MWAWFMSLFRRKSVVGKEKREPTLQEQRDAFTKKTQAAYLEQIAKSLAERQERNLNSERPDIPLRLQSRDELRAARMRREENERRERQNWRGSTTGNVRGPRGNSDLPHPGRRSTDTDQTLSTLLILNATNSFDSEPTRTTHCEPTRSYDSPSSDYGYSGGDSGGGDSGGGGGGCD